MSEEVGHPLEALQCLTPVERERRNVGSSVMPELGRPAFKVTDGVFLRKTGGAFLEGRVEDRRES